MKIPVLSFFAATILFLSGFAATSVEAQPVTKLFTVNYNGDSNDANVGDHFCADAVGRCSLRAAIEEANSNPYQDGINFALPTPATIDLTLGELKITSNIYIAGPGARKLSIQRSLAQGTPNFRIFSIDFTENHPIPVTIRGLSIRNGQSNSDGGAIYNSFSTTVHLIDLAIINNAAAGSGGAIFNVGNIDIRRSLIAANNSNGLFSGGITNFSSTGNVIVTNSTLTNNSGSQGGAFYNAGNLLLINNTISHNAATAGGSSVLNGKTGTVNVLNTIIGMDIASPTSSLSGAFNSLGNNLVTDARNSTGFTNGANGDQVGDNNAINPLLGELADNGGQTDTRALLAGSPAINKGNSCVYNRNCAAPVPSNFRLFSDQRLRYLRLGGTAVDVGAFESDPLTFSVEFGFGVIGFRASRGGTLLILTEAGTNNKQIRTMTPFGNFFFDNLDYGEAYFLERISKRASERRGLTVFSLDSLASLQLPLSASNEEEIKFKFTILDKN